MGGAARSGDGEVLILSKGRVIVAFPEESHGAYFTRHFADFEQNSFHFRLSLAFFAKIMENKGR